MDDGHRLASYDTSLVISGGVDCGRRRRNVYDKKPQCYAKDNRTSHLTTTDRHEASRGLFATAELLNCLYFLVESQVRESGLLLLQC